MVLQPIRSWICVGVSSPTLYCLNITAAAPVLINHGVMFCTIAHLNKLMRHYLLVDVHNCNIVPLSHFYLNAFFTICLTGCVYAACVTKPWLFIPFMSLTNTLSVVAYTSSCSDLRCINLWNCTCFKIISIFSFSVFIQPLRVL